jgi:nucleoside-diphosphate-sugar epimerase
MSTPPTTGATTGPTTGPADTGPLDVLVLGGTSWLGGSVARHAVRRGHRVTCLARGSSGSVPDGAELVQADRGDADAYDAVGRQDWDVLVDVSRQPLHVRTAVAALAGHVGHWVFVSTLSVYASDDIPGADETAPVHPAWAGDGLAPDDAYGPAKVACEQALLDAVPAALVARSGLIVGHGDRSDRFGYWPARFAQAADGDPVLVPPLGDPCQVIDVEDLAGWLVRCGEARRGGTVNAMGPTVPLEEVLRACAQASGVAPRMVEAEGAWLAARGVEPWMGPDSLPLWLPQPEYAGFMTRSRRRADELGLATRPLVSTAEAALAWERERGLERQRHAGLSPARERELLDALDPSDD